MIKTLIIIDVCLLLVLLITATVIAGLYAKVKKSNLDEIEERLNELLKDDFKENKEA